MTDPDFFKHIVETKEYIIDDHQAKQLQTRNTMCYRRFRASLSKEQAISYCHYLKTRTNNTFSIAMTNVKNTRNNPNLVLLNMDIEDGNYARNIVDVTVNHNLDNIKSRIKTLHAKYGRGSVYVQCSSVSKFKQLAPDNIVKLAMNDEVNPIICWAVHYDPLFILSDMMIWLPSNFILGALYM
eukprot:361149_1